MLLKRKTQSQCCHCIRTEAALAAEIADNGTAMEYKKLTTSGGILHRPQLSTGVQQYKGESILEQHALFNHRRNTTCNENLPLTNPFTLHSCFNHTLCNADWNTKLGKICTSTKYLWGSQTVHQSLLFPSLRKVLVSSLTQVQGFTWHDYWQLSGLL